MAGCLFQRDGSRRVSQQLQQFCVAGEIAAGRLFLRRQPSSGFSQLGRILAMRLVFAGQADIPVLVRVQEVALQLVFLFALEIFDLLLPLCFRSAVTADARWRMLTVASTRAASARTCSRAAASSRS